MVTPAAERKAVAHLVDACGMSERRACKAIGCCRMTIRYQTTRADDAGLRQRMKAMAQERRRFGSSAIVACMFCSSGKARSSTTRSSSGSIGRRSLRCAAVAGASGRLGPGRRCWLRWRRTTAGRSTSCRIHEAEVTGNLCMSIACFEVYCARRPWPWTGHT
jgi:hypothetical protein